jgi:hypothetical protein
MCPVTMMDAPSREQLTLVQFPSETTGLMYDSCLRAEKVVTKKSRPLLTDTCDTTQPGER